MSQLPTESPGRSALAKCEKHGLHYDPAKMSGCVICRREERATAGATGATFAGAATSASSGSGRSALGPWLVAAGLCLVAGLVFDQFGERMSDRLFGSRPDVLKAPRAERIDEQIRDLAGGTP